MSVGVCIINRNGIALAADSAGTSPGNKMFYNSMNKVFSLSKKYVYGAITYGTSSVYNVSIEQLLKEFRTFLDGRDCVDDFFNMLDQFIEFINTKNCYFRFNTDEFASCNSLIKALVVDWGNKIKSAIADTDPTDKINSILDAFEADLNDGIKIENFDVSQYVKQTYEQLFETHVSIVVPELKQYEQQKNRLWDIICNFFNLSLKRETDNVMGLFFAGYGANDAFPKYIHLELYTVIGGQVKYRVLEKFDESNHSAKIQPLAQNDVILTFCKGISNYFLNYIPQKAAELINAKIDTLPATFTDEQKNFLKTHLSDCKDSLSIAIDTNVQTNNVDPIINSVRLIPLSEMASLAENLVNITSLRRTYAIDGNQQTVGGPTDVAVLSKGDGFVWIKRKHYFSRELNPNYK